MCLHLQVALRVALHVCPLYALQPERNSVAEAIYDRLCRAIDNKEQFKLVLIVPVHPDGDILNTKAIQM